MLLALLQSFMEPSVLAQSLNHFLFHLKNAAFHFQNHTPQCQRMNALYGVLNKQQLGDQNCGIQQDTCSLHKGGTNSSQSSVMRLELGCIGHHIVTRMYSGAWVLADW